MKCFLVIFLGGKKIGEEKGRRKLFLLKNVNQTISAQIISVVSPFKFWFIGAGEAEAEVLIFEKFVYFILFGIFQAARIAVYEIGGPEFGESVFNCFHG